jgi:hypothetical protein
MFIVHIDLIYICLVVLFFGYYITSCGQETVRRDNCGWTLDPMFATNYSHPVGLPVGPGKLFQRAHQL